MSHYCAHLALLTVRRAVCGDSVSAEEAGRGALLVDEPDEHRPAGVEQVWRNSGAKDEYYVSCAQVHLGVVGLDGVQSHQIVFHHNADGYSSRHGPGPNHLFYMLRLREDTGWRRVQHDQY
jgi:hypothetical protein